MAVEQQHGIPLVEHAVHTVRLDRRELHGIAIEIESGRVLADAEDVRRLAAEQSVLHDACVRAVHVEDRRDHHDHVVEDVLARSEQQVARDQQQRLGRFGLWRMDVAEEKHDRFAGAPRLLRVGDARIRQHHHRRGFAQRTDEHVGDVHPLGLGLERGDVVEQLLGRQRAREFAALGVGLQFHRPFAVPRGRYVVAPIDGARLRKGRDSDGR
jgi:hypothetical protein